MHYRGVTVLWVIAAAAGVIATTLFFDTGPPGPLHRNILLIRAVPKSLLFNLRYFGWRGLALPVFVSHRVRLACLGGRVVLDGPNRPGRVRIGFGYVGLFDGTRSRAVWENHGQVRFRGTAELGHGTKVVVGRHGRLTLGDNFQVTAESSLLCQRRIKFGRDCLLSWDVLVMDDDVHPVYDETGIHVNPPRGVRIGDHVWIGCRSTLLKGTEVGDGSVVGAASVLNKAYEGANLLLAGQPACVRRTGIRWSGRKALNQMISPISISHQNAAGYRRQ
jgi:acetyltransferase-like isoleucine patch superfamily enzyme